MELIEMRTKILERVRQAQTHVNRQGDPLTNKRISEMLQYAIDTRMEALQEEARLERDLRLVREDINALDDIITLVEALDTERMP